MKKNNELTVVIIYLKIARAHRQPRKRSRARVVGDDGSVTTAFRGSHCKRREERALNVR